MFAFNKGLEVWACNGPLEGRLHFSNRLRDSGGLHTGPGWPSRAVKVVWSISRPAPQSRGSVGSLCILKLHPGEMASSVKGLPQEHET